MPTTPGERVCEKFGRQYTDEFNRQHAIKVFHVHFGTAVYLFSDVLLAQNLPLKGDSYAGSQPSLICTGRSVKELGKSNMEFEVECQYDMTPYNTWDIKIGGQSVDKVLDETMAASTGVGIPARFTASPAKYLTTLPSGAAGENVLNRAKDPFDPPVTTTRRQNVITATALVHDITDMGFSSLGALLAMQGKVNDERIQICSIPDETGTGGDYWTFLLDEVSVEKLPTPEGDCDLKITLRIIYDPLAHCAVILNAGYNELIVATTFRRKCRDGGQVEVSAPVPLDKDGVMVAPSALPGATTYIIAPDHETADFSDLMLPLTICGPMPTAAPPPAPIPPLGGSPTPTSTPSP
jgi:hypothetical protein